MPVNVGILNSPVLIEGSYLLPRIVAADYRRGLVADKLQLNSSPGSTAHRFPSLSSSLFTMVSIGGDRENEKGFIRTEGELPRDNSIATAQSRLKEVDQQERATDCYL